MRGGINLLPLIVFLSQCDICDIVSVEDSQMKKLLIFYDNVVENIAAVIYSTMIIVMFLQVVMRYVFNSPFPWAEEVARYMFIWIVYLGAALAVLRRAHLEVDYFTMLLPKKMALVSSYILNFCALMFLLFVFGKGIELTGMNMFAPSYAIRALPQGVVYLAIPTGAAFMAINLARVLIDSFKNRIKQEDRKYR